MSRFCVEIQYSQKNTKKLDFSGICANRYNSCGNYPNKKVNYNVKDKEPHFSSSYDALGAYRKKLISLDSPLWLQWKLDQRVIGSREVPIDVQYESLGAYHEIYAHYLIVGNRKKKFVLYTFEPFLVIFPRPSIRDALWTT